MLPAGHWSSKQHRLEAARRLGLRWLQWQSVSAAYGLPHLQRSMAAVVCRSVRTGSISVSLWWFQGQPECE